MRLPDLVTALEEMREAIESAERSGTPINRQAMVALAFNVNRAFTAARLNDLLTRGCPTGGQTRE
jgi:hypothetical protein